MNSNSKQKARKQRAKGFRQSLVIGSWNVRTLVESSGDERICRKRTAGRGTQNESLGVVDRKLDLVVRELKRFGVSVAGIQESKWFGSDVWRAGEYTFLHSGRPLPSDSDRATRNEGVGIALDEKASAAWRNAGEQWEAVSSRLVTARLRWSWRSASERRKSESVYLTVVCAYAPTAKAPPSIKEKFYTELQDTIDKVPPSDLLIVLGDFNARVGALDDTSDLWRGVLGRHGLPERNQAGEELLEFCAINELSIMNTWFQKKKVHQGTWTHPATKMTHMIDFVLMRANQRVHCRDVRVMRGANCWTDHMLVRTKLNVVAIKRPSKSNRDCVPFAVEKLRISTSRTEYSKALEDLLQDKPHKEEEVSEENWEALKSCILAAADNTLGRRGRTQPEWFEDSLEELIPLIEAKNNAHTKALQSGLPADKKLFRRRQRLVQKAVAEAKEKWICTLASDAEAAVKDSRTRWECIRRLQQTHAGRKPNRPNAIRKEDGTLTQSPEQVIQRWQEHFMKILNVTSVYRDEAVSEMTSFPPLLELDSPPVEEELMDAMSMMKKRKAGGKSGILSELITYGGPELWDRILKLMEQMWMNGQVVADWKDAVIIPIPKKGDLKCCDNWRGISLLDVVGKLFARILKERLEKIADRVLPESQCGFRKGRGCVDMIFVARQLIEKTREHDDVLFMLFVDLKKAYDSIPREALWKVLEKCGAPPRMLSVVKSFHDGMQAEVRIGPASTKSFEVKNGLRQGCTLAPTLFNVYFSGMVASWRSKHVSEGVNVLYRIGRKLVGDRTTKSRLQEVKVTETQFADDAALYSTSRDGFESSTKGFAAVAAEWGMTVSVSKTKGMIVGSNLKESDMDPVQVAGGSLEIVDRFTYLGADICKDGEVTTEVTSRIAKAARAFGCLRKSVFCDKVLSTATKRHVYRAAVLSVLLYGAETWALKAKEARKLNSFHNRCVRSILGVTRYHQWKERLTTRQLGEMFGMKMSILDIILEQRLRWLGHVGRMDETRLPKKILFGELRKTRPRHGAKRRWRDVVKADVEAIGVGEGWYETCQDRKEWFRVCSSGVAEVSKSRRENVSSAVNRQPERGFTCACGRMFRRQSDLTRHRRFCTSES